MNDSPDVIARDLENHKDQCTERYNRIRDDTTEIKATLLAIQQDLKSATDRVHTRIDSAFSKIGAQKVWILSGGGLLLLTILGYVLTTWGPLAEKGVG